MAGQTVIDRGVHPAVPGLSASLPNLDDHWREAVSRRGIDDLSAIGYATRNPPTFRIDWKDAAAKVAASVATLAGGGWRLQAALECGRHRDSGRGVGRAATQP